MFPHFFPQTVSESSSGSWTFSVDQDISAKTHDELFYVEQQSKECVEEKATAIKEVQKVATVDIPHIKEKSPRGNYLLS